MSPRVYGDSGGLQESFIRSDQPITPDLKIRDSTDLLNCLKEVLGVRYLHRPRPPKLSAVGPFTVKAKADGNALSTENSQRRFLNAKIAYDELTDCLKDHQFILASSRNALADENQWTIDDAAVPVPGSAWGD